MEQLIEKHWTDMVQASTQEAFRATGRYRDVADLFQDACVRLIRYPPKLESARDPDSFFMKKFRLELRTAKQRRAGYHTTNTAGITVQAQGERNTQFVGLFQSVLDDEDGDRYYMDERILPPMASAEDVFFSSLPNRRQERLREALESLPEQQREVMYLRTYEELSVAEVASRMGITKERVSHVYQEGKNNLIKKLNPKGGND